MNQDSALARGLKTVAQAVIGLVAVVWGVPGVPEAVTQYVQNNFLVIVVAFGVPAGVVSFVWNLLRPSVKNF